MKIKYYLKEMRVHHYIKNLLVFVPLACSGQLLSFHKAITAFCGFISFCFISSAIYIFNDINDINEDRNHPTKKKRPIASGKIKTTEAKIFTAVLIILSSIFNFYSFKAFPTILLAFYFILNLGYSLGLKNIPLLDISILVSGFIIRALYGALITDIKISNWLYLVIMSVSFYLGLGKRRNELRVQSDGSSRKVMKKYPFSFLDRNMYMCMALTDVFYALWTVDSETVSAYNNNGLIWTVPIVMLIFMKYSLTIEGISDGDPVEVLLHDKVLIILCVIYLILMFSILYIF